jgi:hypothetical protein
MPRASKRSVRVMFNFRPWEEAFQIDNANLSLKEARGWERYEIGRHTFVRGIVINEAYGGELPRTVFLLFHGPRPLDPRLWNYGLSCIASEDFFPPIDDPRPLLWRDIASRANQITNETLVAFIEANFSELEAFAALSEPPPRR